MVEPIPEDDTVTVTDKNRERAYSHTRTNSSSSSASSHMPSPPGVNQGGPLHNLPQYAPMTNDDESDGSVNTATSNSSSPKVQYQHTASEAAAVAAIRNTVNNVQIQSTSEQRPKVQEAKQTYQQIKKENPGKLHSVAASAAAFAAKPKESALSKAKLFARQAKPHLTSSSSSSSLKEQGSKRKNVDLTVNTKQLPPSRPSLSERSPLSRPSKELERIASIGSPGATATANDPPPKQHKHHISFRSRKDKKDSHGGVVLSSSASNSKLINEAGSIYSFHPSSPNMASIDVKNLNTKEDRVQLAEESWQLLCSRLNPLFLGDGLRVPIEDLNNLVLMHVNFLIKQGGTARDIMGEVRQLLKVGMYNLDSGLGMASDAKLISRFVEVWVHFFAQVMPYLEGVFLPLQAEFEGAGQVLNQEEAKEFWSMLLVKEGRLTTRRYILMSFRDNVLIPISERMESLLASPQSYIDFGGTEGSQVSDTLVRLLQCTNVMASIQSDDDAQKRIDGLVKALRSSWMTSRSGKDRRGLVLGKN